MALAVLGAVVLLIGLGFAASGGTLLWAYGTQRDASGYFTTSTQTFTSTGYALTSTVDFGAEPGPHEWVPIHSFGTIRIRAALAGAGSVFVGIGREAAVDGYLEHVAHDEVTDVSLAPFRASYHHVDGGAVAPPSSVPIWSVSASGTGRQSLTWATRPGRWEIVVMRADARASVVAAVSVGAKAGWVFPLSLGLLGGALIFVVGGSLIMLRATRRRGELATLPGGAGTGASPPPPPPPGSLPAAGTGPGFDSGVLVPPPPPPPLSGVKYPLRIEGRLDEPLSRWLWLVKWLLALPHYLVLSLLWVAFGVLTFIAGVGVLITGRYPPGIFEFNVGVLRWTWRVAYYSYSALGTDRYPPFSLAPDPTYPADLEVEYPERLSRALVLVKWWLLALPQYVVVAVLAGGWSLLPWRHSDAFVPALSGGLIGILVLAAGVVLAVSGRYPDQLFGIVLGLNRWVYRVIVYAALMRDEYPPFHLDPGGRDPGGPGGPVTATRTDRRGTLPGAA